MPCRHVILNLFLVFYIICVLQRYKYTYQMDPWCELDTAISLDQFTCENDTTPVSEESNGRRKWEKTYELPACRVCGRKGSGLHYGVNTCEACKVNLQLCIYIKVNLGIF